MFAGKRAFLVRGLLIVLLLAALVLLLVAALQEATPTEPNFSDPPLSTAPADAVALLRRAYQFEAAGDVDTAKKYYDNVLALKDQATSDVAIGAELRIAARAQNFPVRIKQILTDTLAWAVDLGAKGALIAAVLLALVGVVYFRRSDHISYEIAEFDDLTGNTGWGAGLARAIGVALHRIQHVHQSAQGGSLFIADNLDLPNTYAMGEKPPDFIEQLTKMNVSAFNVPVPAEEILRYIQRLGQTRYQLSGQLAAKDKDAFLYLFLQREDTRKIEASWQLTQTIENSYDLLKLGEQVAYNFILHLSKSVGTARWENLAALTDALADIQRYRMYPSEYETLKRAITALEGAASTDPGYIVAHYNLGLAYLENAQYEDARTTFEWLQSTPDAQHLRYQVAYNLGVSCYQIMDTRLLDKAQAAFEQVTHDAHQGSLPGLDKETGGQLLFLSYSGLASTFARRMRRADDQEIETFYRQFEAVRDSALRTLNDPAHPMLCIVKVSDAEADCYRKAYASGITKAQEGIKLNPSYSRGYIVLADLYEALEEPDNAIAALERLLKIRPFSEYGCYRLAQLYHKRALESRDKGKKAADETQRWFAQAVQVLEPVRRFAYGLSFFGRVYSDMGDLDKAIEKYQEAVVRVPELYMAWQGLSWCLTEYPSPSPEQTTAAVEAAQNYLIQLQKQDREGARKPSLWNAYALLGRALTLDQKFDDAQQNLTQAVELSNCHPQPVVYLAQLYLAQDNPTLAREQLVLALKNVDDPQFKSARVFWKERASKLMKSLK